MSTHWSPIWALETLISYIWLVVWNIFYFPYIGNSNPNWLIFFRGVGLPPTRYDRPMLIKPARRFWDVVVCHSTPEPQILGQKCGSDFLVFIYGYGSIAMKIPFLVGWTSILSQLFWCEQKRGTIGFDTLPYFHGVPNQSHSVCTYFQVSFASLPVLSIVHRWFPLFYVKAHSWERRPGTLPPFKDWALKSPVRLNRFWEQRGGANCIPIAWFIHTSFLYGITPQKLSTFPINRNMSSNIKHNPCTMEQHD